ncbi:MAG: Transcriptional regulator, LuxR family [Acidimicrobiia bacterium]|nr:Transcriptional regulator, LuxR family [Acidimicrobiia bacterium]
MATPAQHRAVQDVLHACYSGGDDLGGLRGGLLRTLRRAVPFDAAFVAFTDPDTLLFTSAFAEEPLGPSAPLFLGNEFGSGHDVNRFADLAHAPDVVASLDGATQGDRSSSARWRDIMGPLGLGDEVRVALRSDATSWGFLCLHRSGPSGFTAAEMATLRRIAPHAGEAIRRTAAIAATRMSTSDVPGQSQAVVLVADHMVLAVAGSVDEIQADVPTVGRPLPLPLAAVVHRLEGIEQGGAEREAPPAVVRMTTKSGALVTVHAARLRDAAGNGSVVLTISPATSGERSSLLLAAHGLTPAQRRVAELVLQGRTTQQIVVSLKISAHTVQDHLKVVFDKTGVRSRRELVTMLMHAPR